MHSDRAKPQCPFRRNFKLSFNLKCRLPTTALSIVATHSIDVTVGIGTSSPICSSMALDGWSTDSLKTTTSLFKLAIQPEPQREREEGGGERGRECRERERVGRRQRKCEREGWGDRERERGGERERDRERQRQTETDRQTEKQRQRQTDKQTDRTPTVDLDQDRPIARMDNNHSPPRISWTTKASSVRPSALVPFIYRRQRERGARSTLLLARRVCGWLSNVNRLLFLLLTLLRSVAQELTEQD